MICFYATSDEYIIIDFIPQNDHIKLSVQLQYEDPTSCMINNDDLAYLKEEKYYASVSTQTIRHVLMQFRDQLHTLYTNLHGEAIFSIGDHMKLTLKVDHLGHIKIHVYLHDIAQKEISYAFEPDLDQSYLPKIISMIEENMPAQNDVQSNIIPVFKQDETFYPHCDQKGYNKFYTILYIPSVFILNGSFFKRFKEVDTSVMTKDKKFILNIGSVVIECTALYLEDTIDKLNALRSYFKQFNNFDETIFEQAESMYCIVRCFIKPYYTPDITKFIRNFISVTKGRAFCQGSPGDLQVDDYGTWLYDEFGLHDELGITSNVTDFIMRRL